MRFGYWLPVFGGWLRNVEDERMEAEWSYVRRLARASERAGFDLTLIAELNLNDIKGPDAPALDAWSTAAALAAVTDRLELMVAVRPTFHPPAAPDGVRRRRISGGEIADCPILRRVPHAWRPAGAHRGEDQRHASVARDARGGARAYGLWSRGLCRVSRHRGRCPP